MEILKPGAQADEVEEVVRKLVKELWVRGRRVLSRKEKYVGRYIR